jgi:hypothetical protein
LNSKGLIHKLEDSAANTNTAIHSGTAAITTKT